MRRMILGASADPVRDGLLTIGRHSYNPPHVVRYEGVLDIAQVGAFCSIADGVTFVIGGNHRLDWASTFPLRARWGLPGAFADGHPMSKGPIVVGNDVWIGRDARVFDGVTIGDGAVVASGAYVTTEVAPYEVVGGVPARVIKRRCSEAEARALQEIAWWDWPDELIRERVADINGLPLSEFVSRYRRSALS